MGRTIVTRRDVADERSIRIEPEPTESEINVRAWPRELAQEVPADSEIMRMIFKEQLEKAEQEGNIELAKQLREYLQEEEKRADSVDQTSQDAVFDGEAPSLPTGVDSYVDRLLKYVPAESVALYLTLQGIVISGAEGPSLNSWLWGILGIGLIGTPIYLWRIVKVGKIAQLLVSTAAFCVWVFALGGAFASLSWYEPFIGSLVLVVFTFFVPLINPDLLSSNQT
jgi:hypothetical protein